MTLNGAYSYLDEIERITAKDYSPTDGAFLIVRRILPLIRLKMMY